MAAAAAPAGVMSVVRYPMPSSPHGPSGVSNAQGVIRPPRRVDSKGNQKPARETDWICPPGHILLSVKDKTDRPLNNQGIPLSAKRQRRGEVPNLTANFFELSFTDVDHTKLDYTLEFFGVSHEGVTDFKAAKKYPDSAGRVTAAVQGAVTIFCDHRYLERAEPGDILEYVPCDSRLRWIDGHQQFAPCIVRKYEETFRRHDSDYSDSSDEGEGEGDDYGLPQVPRSPSPPSPSPPSPSPQSPPQLPTKPPTTSTTPPSRDESPEQKRKYKEVEDSFAQINVALQQKEILLTVRGQIEDAMRNPSQNIESIKQLMLAGNVISTTQILDVGEIVVELADFASSLTRLYTGVGKFPPLDSLVNKYVRDVLNKTYGSKAHGISDVRQIEICFQRKQSKNTILNAMYYTILRDISKYYWNGDDFDKFTRCFYNVVKEDNISLEPDSQSDAIWAFLRAHRELSDDVDALQEATHVYKPSSVFNQWTWRNASGMPTIGEFQPETKVPRDPEINANKLIERVVNKLACNDYFESKSKPGDEWLTALVKDHSFTVVFNLKCSNLIIPLWEARRGMTSVSKSSVMTSYDFSDIHKTPVLSRDHEAAVLSTRAAIKAYEAHTGQSLVIRHIPTKGFFISRKNITLHTEFKSEKHRCFATLIEKGIGAYKNEIRVYLNPSLRAF